MIKRLLSKLILIEDEKRLFFITSISFIKLFFKSIFLILTLLFIISYNGLILFILLNDKSNFFNFEKFFKGSISDILLRLKFSSSKLLN